MANQELQEILTNCRRDQQRLIKRLNLWQERGNDVKCDQIYSQLWVVNSNIEYCEQNLSKEAQE